MANTDMTRVVTLPRRKVLAAGGVVAVGGVLVACGGGESAAPTVADKTAEEAEIAEEIGDEEVAADQGEQLVAVSEVPVEGGVVIEEPPVVVVQPSEGDIKAFSAVCPHQGCLMSSVEANEIFCPCHGSLFSAEDGAVLAGPANSGLPAVTVRVQDDAVYLG
ncbi:MAG: Rieske (2Fe-2S) protein [Actinomycetota bacterium]|nr:Rieske (2Fe-2S) protein [Actinomycetota bacterium]